jgi:hypothetical protein
MSKSNDDESFSSSSSDDDEKLYTDEYWKKEYLEKKMEYLNLKSKFKKKK